MAYIMLGKEKHLDGLHFFSQLVCDGGPDCRHWVGYVADTDGGCQSNLVENGMHRIRKGRIKHLYVQSSPLDGLHEFMDQCQVHW